MVIEGPYAQVVPCAEEEPLTPVEQGEREVSEQAGRAVLAPSVVGGQDELAVGRRAFGLGVQAEYGREIVPIVEPRVGCKDEGAVGAGDGLRLVVLSPAGAA